MLKFNLVENTKLSSLSSLITIAELIKHHGTHGREDAATVRFSVSSSTVHNSNTFQVANEHCF